MKTILRESDIKSLVRKILKEVNVRDADNQGTPDSIIALAKHVEFRFSNKNLLDIVSIENYGNLVIIIFNNNDLKWKRFFIIFYKFKR